MPRCYAYVRFSTPEQEQGDSYRRQIEAAEQYAEREGMELDREIKLFDRGVSAFRGRHVSGKGRLGEFLALAEAGAIEPGSHLLVENIDRLTRQGAWKAVGDIIARLVRAGVVVVTLSPERVYSEKTMSGPEGMMRMMELMFGAERASGESTRKAGMLRSAWTAKRRRAKETPLSARGPSWLELDRATGTWAVIEERAAVVRRIFTEAAAGRGAHAITEGLNRDGVPPFGRGEHWHRSAVVKLLNAENVIGTYEAHTFDPAADGYNTKRRTPAGKIAGYYTAVVDPELFRRVQDLRSTDVDGKRQARRGGQAQSSAHNLLGGLARCSVCGGTAVMVNKGATAKVGPNARYLVCGKARVGAGCIYAAVPYPIIEEALLNRLPLLVATAPAGEGAEAIDAELANLEAEDLHLANAYTTVREELRRGRSTAAATLIRDLDKDGERIRARRAELEAQKEAAAGPLVAKRLDALLTAATAEEMDRAAVNRAMREVFTAAVVDPDWGTVRLTYRHGGEAEFMFRFPQTGGDGEGRTRDGAGVLLTPASLA